MENRGQILAIAAADSRLTKKQLAERAGYKRATYYKHVKNSRLPDHVLMKYGRVLEYDFTIKIPGMRKYILDHEPKSGNQLSFKEAIGQLKKHIELLAKDAEIIEEKFLKKKR